MTFSSETRIFDIDCPDPENTLEAHSNGDNEPE